MGLLNNSLVQNINIGNGVSYVNGNMANLFFNCYNFNSPVTIPNGVTNLYRSFYYCNSFNQPVKIPNSVTNAFQLFFGCCMFNQPLTILEHGNASVLWMDGLLHNCFNYNQPVVFPENVRLNAVFKNCWNFNQPITLPSKCLTFYEMFSGCRNFNQPIVIPNNTGAFDASRMFDECTNLNSNVFIGTGINNVSRMFQHCIGFGGSLYIYENNVTNIQNMFYGRYSNGGTPLLTIYCDNRSNTFNCFRYNNSNAAKRAFIVNISWATNGTFVYNAGFNVKLSTTTRF